MFPFTDMGEVGHYGVARCFWHGQQFMKGKRTKGYSFEREDYVMKQIRAMQQLGAAPDDSGRYLLDIKDKAELAEAVNDTRLALDTVRDVLIEYKKILKDCGGIDPETEKALTEAVGGQVVNITDKSRMLLLLKLSEGLSKIDERHYRIDSPNLAHKSEVELMAGRTVDMSERIILGVSEQLAAGKSLDEVSDTWKAEFKQILMAMRPVKKV